MVGSPNITVGNFVADKTLLTDLMRIRAPYKDMPWAAQQVSPLQMKWQLHAVAQKSPIGYDGALFSTEIDGKTHYFIFHQGTNDALDLPSLSRIVTGNEPQQALDAKRFSAYARNYIAKQHPGEDIPLVQIGYSLGGPLAVLSARPEEPIITYESPGVKEILSNKGIDSASVGNHLLEILSPHATFINSCGTHVGKVLEAGPKFWAPKQISLLDYVIGSIFAHRRKRLCDGLSTLDELKTVPAAETGRPADVWDSFREYIGDYIGENPNILERHLASTAEVIDKMGWDKQFIQAIGAGTNAVFSAITKKYEEEAAKENAPDIRIRTHPYVKKENVQDVDLSVNAPPASPGSFATRVLNQNAEQKDRTLGG